MYQQGSTTPMAEKVKEKYTKLNKSILNNNGLSLHKIQC